MADRDIQVLIKLRDELSAQIKQTEGNVRAATGEMGAAAGGLTKAFSAVAIAAAAIGVAWKTYEFGKKGVEEFQATAAAAAKLTSVLGIHSVALEDMAKSLAHVSIFKKQEIMETEAAIARYAKSEQGIKLLLPAVLKLASATGIDLTTAARLAGTTIDSNMNSLKRYGVEAHGAAGSTERFDSVISSINSTFGNASKAMFDALGPLGQLRKMSDEVAESFASGFVPALQSLAKELLGQQGSIEDLAKSVGKNLGSAIGELAHYLKDNKDEIKSGFTSIANFATAVAQNIANLSLALKFFWDVSGGNLKAAKADWAEMEAYDKRAAEKEASGGWTGSYGTTAKPAAGGFAHGAMGGFSGGLALHSLAQDKIGKKPSSEIGGMAKVQMEFEKSGVEDWQNALDKQNEAYDKYLEEQENSKKKSLEEVARMQHEYESPEGKIKSEAAEKIKQVQTAAKDPSVISAQNADKLIRQIEKKRDEDLKKEKVKAFTEQAQLYAGMAEKVIQIGNNIAAVQMNNVEADKKAQTDAVEHSKMSATAKAKKIEEINKQAQAKEREIKKEQQGWSIAQAIISGAVGVMQGYAQYGPIVGTIMAVLTAAVTATEVAVIASQKFAGGGVVQKKYGGGGTDSEPAMLTPGEVVLRPDQFAALRGGSSTSGATHHHYDLSINVNGSASQSTVSQIRQSLVEQIKALKRTMQQAQRIRQIS